MVDTKTGTRSQNSGCGVRFGVLLQNNKTMSRGKRQIERDMKLFVQFIRHAHVHEQTRKDISCTFLRSRQLANFSYVQFAQVDLFLHLETYVFVHRDGSDGSVFVTNHFSGMDGLWSAENLNHDKCFSRGLNLLVGDQSLQEGTRMPPM